MKLHRAGATLFVPDQGAEDEALARTTHLGIGAHQDDLEFFAWHGIDACYQRSDRWFAGVTCTNGAGSPRSGPYADYTDEEMITVRAAEQDKAAAIGEYGAMIQLGYASDEVKGAANLEVVDDLETILRAAQPDVLYLHNPADKHDTHIAVLLRSLAAVRRLPPDLRPAQAWGCEVWRGLDWLLDEDKVALPASARQDLQATLTGVFESQIAGGKRYDLAVMGRRLANATFHSSHAADVEKGLTWAIDLSPLVHDDSLDIATFTTGFVDRLRDDIVERLRRFS